MRAQFLIAAWLVAACSSAASTRRHVATYASGQARWEVQLVRGVPHGPSTTWHDNGHIASRGNFDHGVREGEFVYYNRHGEVVARKRFVHGRLVSTRNGPGRRAPPLAPPGRQTVPPPFDDTYHEIQLAIVFGATDSAVERSAGDRERGVGGIGVSYTRHAGSLIYGVTSSIAVQGYGPAHSYLGGVCGLALHPAPVHTELLVEAGSHFVSGIGDDLLTEATGETEATLPYVGAQVRFVNDIGEPKQFVLELSIRVRRDLMTGERHVSPGCFFGCPPDQRWDVGGTTADVAAGVNYQF